MGLYETRGKMKHQFYFLMKQTLSLFLVQNNISVSLSPRRFCVSYSPIHPYIMLLIIELKIIEYPGGKKDEFVRKMRTGPFFNYQLMCKATIFQNSCHFPSFGCIILALEHK
jgi:hypothetical protein